MEINEQDQGGVIVLEPTGRLDSMSCRNFEARLLAALDQRGAVVVDCKGLEYVSSAGLRALLVACLLYTSPSPRDGLLSRMPSSA